MTSTLDAAVLAGGDHLIVFADGHQVTVFGPAGADLFDEVFCHPGLDVDWDHAEDSAELFLSGDPKLTKGRLFLEVPVEDVRKLIGERGGYGQEPS
ncbi:hypothetical protein [Streptomyces prasinopilosus]|uniref:hypothetical protein n=1 Tax=Streptomyces prasinopilosus TaxID=67344 RepID=UPI0006EB594D|nr:hypothetical protein [Streptomyces prasinopilosus]